MHCTTQHSANEITFMKIYYTPMYSTKVESDLVEHCVILVLLLNAFTGLVFV